MDRILLLAAALLWGGTLSAQRISTQFLGAFSFMGVRYLAGFLSMLTIVYWEQRYHNHATVSYTHLTLPTTSRV